MSDALGRGGTTSKRSPPRQAEDRDSTVVLRSTRGTGLPPRILSSGRGRGAGRGGGMRVWPVVRPQSGSVPPWANRGKTVDTYIPSRSMLDGGRDEGGSRYMSRKEPPTQPKWDRERSRTPLPHPRMMSSSPPSGSRPNTGATSGYSAGPSHQRWMAPEDQAGPSRYSVPEPQEEREPVIQSGISSSTSSAHLQSNPNPPDATNTVRRSSHSETEMETDMCKPGPSKGVKRQPSPMVNPNTETMYDEKEDMQMDTPGAGPSRVPGPALEAEQSLGKDVKPDLSALEGEELPNIADEDRQDGVLAVKRSLVLQCYEKNVAIRTAARKAFRVQKTAELSAVGRIVQHVLWRDDGVGVQWIRARTPKSPKKAATAPEETTPRISISIEPSSSKHLPATPLDQLSRPTRPMTPPPVQPPSPKRPNTPPIAIKPPPSASVFPLPAQIPQHTLPPKPVTQPSLSTVHPDAGPSGTSHHESDPVRLPDESRPLTKGQKKRAYEKKCAEIKKRKADDEPLEGWSTKSPKLPKVEQANSATGSSEGQTLTKKERRALNRQLEQLEQERLEEIALNGTVETGKEPPKTASKRTERRKLVKAKAKKQEEKAKRKEIYDLSRTGKSNAITEAVSTSANAISLGAGSKSAVHQEGKGKGKEKAVNNSADKDTAKAKRIIDLSDDTLINGSAKELSKDKSKGKAREIVDLTKDSSNDNLNLPPPPARNPAKATTASTTASKPTTIPARPVASSSTSRVGVPTVRPSTVRPPIPTPTSVRPTAPIRPSVRPPTTAPVRPSASNVSSRPLAFNSSAGRPPPHPTIGRPPPSTTVVRPPTSTSSAARPPPGALGRPPPPRTTNLRIPSDSSDITRPTAHPQYQAPLGQSSYSERQALAALARPPIGQPVRPAGTKFLPRPAASIQARPPVPAALSAVRPSASTDANQTRSLHRSSTLSSSSPLGGIDMLPSRSLTPAVTTPRYKELRRLLSEKMEEMDNWTSMLVDLPDRAEMTQRQIDRTRQECFVLQKQMRDEKDKAGS